MKKAPVFISFATQKGGVGKSTLTIFAASWLHYVKGVNVAVVDCDYPQHSIHKQKARDTALVVCSPPYQAMLAAQWEQLGRKAYPVIASTPRQALEAWKAFAAKEQTHYDVVLFDLPGTTDSNGVLSTITSLDYLFVPLKADRMVLESTLNFATTLNDRLIKTGTSQIKDLYLFWNMVDRRERNRLIEIYDTGINQLGLNCLRTAIPVRSNFTKDLAPGGGAVYRCTLLAPDRAFTKECGFDDLMAELCAILNLQSDGIQTESTNYFVPEQHLVWIPQNVEHELSSNNRQISLLMFYVALDLSEEDTRQQFGIYNTTTFIWENLKFISSAEGLIRESEQSDLYNYALNFFRLLPTMSQSSKIPLQALAIPDDVRLHPVLHYIMAHIGEDLKIKQVAQSFGFSVRNLSRLMLISGIRFSTYLNYQRITRAIELFADGDKTMQQIAYEVGFNTPNNFNRVFKQLTGVNPSTFCHNRKAIHD